ncbi:MAG: HD domain-containing protein, partial [Candidatus Nealsonbacteria bacterium]|nr:HD domain-containing protein [Candidatus Nealsonbacteria bacterium]
MDAVARSTLLAIQTPFEAGRACARHADGFRPDVFDEQQWKLLLQALDTEWTIFNGDSGELLYVDTDQPPRDWTLQAELCREVARRGRPEFIDDQDPLLVLALPITDVKGNPAVAVGTFVVRPIESTEDLAPAARALGMGLEETATWAERQEVWPVSLLGRVAELVVSQWDAAGQAAKLQQEADKLSVHLASTYEEISLLYRLTQHLKISESDEGLGRIALQWMKEVVPAEALAIQLLPMAEDDRRISHELRHESVLLTHGDCPIDNGQFTALVEHLGADTAQRPIVVNPPVSTDRQWPHPEIRQMVVVSLAEGENLFGYLVAMNHIEDDEFGTVEATLMSSVAAILGIHSGNIELYRRHSELMEGIIRALTSAIDAKDRYTCGHSDRVARIAVRLAEELGCDAETINTIHLSGLLHDIGKIGTDDSVLCKPGKLTHEEYEHIKGH